MKKLTILLLLLASAATIMAQRTRIKLDQLEKAPDTISVVKAGPDSVAVWGVVAGFSDTYLTTADVNTTTNIVTLSGSAGPDVVFDLSHLDGGGGGPEVDPVYSADSAFILFWSDTLNVIATRAWVESQGYLTSETDPVWTAEKPNYPNRTELADTSSAIRADFPSGQSLLAGINISFSNDSINNLIDTVTSVPPVIEGYEGRLIFLTVDSSLRIQYRGNFVPLGGGGGGGPETDPVWLADKPNYPDRVELADTASDIRADLLPLSGDAPNQGDVLIYNTATSVYEPEIAPIQAMTGITPNEENGPTFQFLKYRGISGQFGPVNNYLFLNNLADVDVLTTPPTLDQVLKWDGANWVPGDDLTGGGAADGVATAGALDVPNQEIDITVAAPGSDFSINMGSVGSMAQFDAWDKNAADDLPDAPSDGNAYARQNGAWEVTDTLRFTDSAARDFFLSTGRDSVIFLGGFGIIGSAVSETATLEADSSEVATVHATTKRVLQVSVSSSAATLDAGGHGFTSFALDYGAETSCTLTFSNIPEEADFFIHVKNAEDTNTLTWPAGTLDMLGASKGATTIDNTEDTRIFWVYYDGTNYWIR